MDYNIVVKSKENNICRSKVYFAKDLLTHGNENAYDVIQQRYKFDHRM